MWLGRFLWLAIILVLTMATSTSQRSLRIDEDENGVKVETLLSPRFELEPGSVSNKFYYGIDFPKGHIGVRGFDAEVVDEEGNSIPLHETYLHHWVVGKLMIPKGVEAEKDNYNETSTLVYNSGVCAELPQYFGLGSETRKTDTRVPDPYGIEVGNPPPGFVEGWLLNLHAIDTRGAEDKMGCIECRCELYNVTEDESGMPIEKRRNCREEAATGNGAWSEKMEKMELCSMEGVVGEDEENGFVIEYGVDACSAAAATDECVHSKSLTVSLPKGGDLIYAVAHQHTGGVGSSLFGEDGRVLCNSFPIYGNGTEAGNEDGYLVGMSSCYPQPGSVKIAPMEKLTIISNYSSAQMHTGVMGYYYILVAEPLPKSNPFFHSLDVVFNLGSNDVMCSSTSSNHAGVSCGLLN
nr:Protein kinase UbiB [Ipomoea batatas]